MITKITILLLAIAGLSFAKPDSYSPCVKALESMEGVKKYSEKAEKAKGWDKTQSHLKKAIKISKNALNEAKECGCGDAEKSIKSITSITKKGYKDDSWDDTKKKAKQASKESKDAIKALEGCIAKPPVAPAEAQPISE